MNQSKILAKQLLDIKAVSLSPLNPYTWASGLKAPIYCDNRITLAYPEVRATITHGLLTIIKHQYPDVEVIAGTATAGIPQAALVAHEMKLPMIYVRGKHKEHGKGNQIEGVLHKGQKVVVVEDLISTGGSCIDVCKAIQDQGGLVLGVVANFSYELNKGIVAFKEAGIEAHTISNYSDLIECACDNGVINDDELVVLKRWRDNPEGWLDS